MTFIEDTKSVIVEPYDYLFEAGCKNLADVFYPTWRDKNIEKWKEIVKAEMLKPRWFGFVKSKYLDKTISEKEMVNFSNNWGDSFMRFRYDSPQSIREQYQEKISEYETIIAAMKNGNSVVVSTHSYNLAINHTDYTLWTVRG